MRIVGGELSGRRLVQPRDKAIRPTTDRTRESLFNILNHGWNIELGGKHVMDLFAGTGALGLEALSRGAASCTFVEKNAQGRALIEENTSNLGLAGRAELLRCDAAALGQRDTLRKAAIVFADPPYAKSLAEKALKALHAGNWLTHDAVVIIEEGLGHLPKANDNFELTDERRFGDTAIGLFQYVATR